jgi:proteasome assembly chaperone (PAC2) family protein
MIRTEGVPELMKNTIFYSKAAVSSSNDVLLLTGDSQPISPESEYLLAEQIFDIAAKFNTKKVFALAAFVTGMFVDKPRVFGTATDSDIVKTVPEKNDI